MLVSASRKGTLRFGGRCLERRPAVIFSGLLKPLSSLSYGARLTRLVIPRTYFQRINVGYFTTTLGFTDLTTPMMFVVANWWPAIPTLGSIPLFIFGTAVYLFALTALGILLATLANSMPQFALLGISVYLVLNLLSGGITPLESMPQTLQSMLWFFPATHFVTFAQGILFRAAGLEVVCSQVAVVAGIGLVLFAATLVRFRKSLIEGQ